MDGQSQHDVAVITAFFNKFPLLQSVEFQDNFDPKQLQGLYFSNLPNLRALALTVCVLNQGWETPLTSMTGLTALSLRSCLLKGDTLSPLTTLENLNALDLSYFKSKGRPHFDLAELTNLSKLTYINLCQASFTNISSLKEFKRLKSVNLRWCLDIPNDTFQNLDLVELDVSKTRIDFSVLEQLTSLTHLNARSCTSFVPESIESIGKLQLLKNLNLSRNVWVSNLDALSTLTNLETLNVSNCVDLKIHHFEVLRSFKNLKEIDMGAIDLTQLPPQILECKQVTNVNAWWNRKMWTLGNLESLKCLDSLELQDCNSINWPNYLYLVNECKLRKLIVSGCRRGQSTGELTGLNLKAMYSLRHFEVSNAGVTDNDVLFFVQKMPDLRFLNLSKNYKVTEIGGWEILKGLIDLEYCNVWYTGIVEHDQQGLFYKLHSL
eukprot:TRINITY_DN971_c1_g2_i2.p1 TRINITY_DN971_c1_g2~~TRINITY_DN971_c1_g2_i2.p1  ORF type:complete len:435 (+),score=42.91 TRINITY_DN971_c1_g2_i2:389-1693(+)